MKTMTLTKRLLMLSLVVGILGFTSCSDDEPSVAAPNAAFTVAVDGLTVTLTDASIGADSYSWNFGDGNSSTDAAPTHTYAEGGTYTIELTVTNAGGSDTATESVTAEAPFSANLVGTWRITSEAGSLAVGPTAGSAEWWSLDATGVADRACYLDDDYVFGSDGTFSISMGDQTWVEAWQEGVDGDGCGAPVAPHDGSGSYTFSATASALTINGEGGFVGLAKVGNAGELATDNVRNDVPIPSSITYNIASFADNTMTLQIEAGSGVWWQYQLTKVQ